MCLTLTKKFVDKTVKFYSDVKDMNETHKS